MSTDATKPAASYMQVAYHSLPVLPVVAEWTVPVGSNLVTVSIRGQTKPTIADLDALVEYLLLFRKQYQPPTS